MPYLDNNIPSNIYCEFIGCEILRFARTTSDINCFVIHSNRLLKRMQKEGGKHRYIISMLNKIKFSLVFNILAGTAANFIRLFSLPQIRVIYMHGCLLHSLFLLFDFLLDCLFGYHVIIASVSSIFVSMFLDLLMLIWVGILYYNLTII